MQTKTKAKPISAQAEAGNGKIVRGLWNDEFLRELENFPAEKHDDEFDALSGAYEVRFAEAFEAVKRRQGLPRIYGDEPENPGYPLAIRHATAAP